MAGNHSNLNLKGTSPHCCWICPGNAKVVYTGVYCANEKGSELWADNAWSGKFKGYFLSLFLFLAVHTV